MKLKRFLLEVCMVMILITGGVSCALLSAEDKTIKFTINYLDDEEIDDLVFDFYHVANIDWEGTGGSSGQTTYLIGEVEEVFSGIIKDTDRDIGVEYDESTHTTGGFHNQNMSYDRLEEIASQALGIVLSKNVTAVTTTSSSTNPSISGNAYTYSYTINVDETSSVGGVYLAVAHRSSESKADYIINDTDEEDKEVYRTHAESKTKNYVFRPYLVFVSGDHPGTIAPGADGKVTLDNEKVLIKYELRERYGKLKITKELESFSHHATFAYKVEWFKEYKNGQLTTPINWKLATIDTTESGTDENGNYYTYIGHIPVGSYVRVSEFYTGAGYEAVSVRAVLKDGTIVTPESKTRIGNDGSLILFVDEEDEDHVLEVIYKNKPSVPVFGYGFNNRIYKTDKWYHEEEGDR